MENTLEGQTDIPTVSTSAEQQEMVALAKQFLGEQAKIMGDMQRQKAALFATLVLCADHMGGVVGRIDEALVKPPSQKKRKENDGEPVPGSSGLQDGN